MDEPNPWMPACAYVLNKKPTQVVRRPVAAFMGLCGYVSTASGSAPPPLQHHVADSDRAFGSLRKLLKNANTITRAINTTIFVCVLL